ncbi:unnamed protein product [Caenorhabditis auriculariae]|uniref:Uncharacterized protein n=1 Tax=Caenorhabditis auriculariae TaxID=2777116 RepID=A0A8S1HFK6_9PELO|nr:unnamed protein product [Caenorhabditis auriculariae]
MDSRGLASDIANEGKKDDFSGRKFTKVILDRGGDGKARDGPADKLGEPIRTKQEGVPAVNGYLLGSRLIDVLITASGIADDGQTLGQSIETFFLVMERALRLVTLKTR